MSVDASDRDPARASPPISIERSLPGCFLAMRRRIYGFIMTLVFNHHDAEEVFQNTTSILWNKFADFEPGSNFFAWASRIAYYEVLSLMKQQRRSRTFSDERWNCSPTRRLRMSDQSIRALRGLEECLAQIDPRPIANCCRSVTISSGRPNKLRPAVEIGARNLPGLTRIHNVLLNCVQRTLKADTHMSMRIGREREIREIAIAANSGEASDEQIARLDELIRSDRQLGQLRGSACSTSRRRLPGKVDG